MRAEDINLDDYEAFRQGKHHAWFTWLRHNAPVWRKPDPDGPGAWVFSKHADIVAASRDTATFSSELSNSGVLGTSHRDIGRLRFAPEQKQFIMMDPPEHTGCRSVVQPMFARNKVGERFSDRIREVADRLLSAAIAKGRFDFVEDIAVQLPLQVVGEAIGVPEEDRRDLFEWVNVIGSPNDPTYCRGPEHFAEAGGAVAAYGRKMIQQRLDSPADDLMTILAHAESDGVPWTEERKVTHFRLIWSAGSETTRTALAHGMRAFIDNPDAFDLIRSQPALLNGPAVEEVLRWSTPVMYFRRTVMNEVVIRDTVLSPGDHVLLWYVSGDRDEDVFPDPFTFDVTRSPNPHLAFGGGGPHFCLGAYLARLELRIMFECIAERVRAPRFAGEPEMAVGNFFNVMRHLPVDFTARTAAVA
jgi:cholest-4-en-3-one 26-monooxygenase